MMRTLLVGLMAAGASAQFGRKRGVEEAAAGSLGDLGAAADARASMSDVDLAMAGWDQLKQNPDKMAEVMKGFKDPEVWAKAQEMLKDPQYMAAAKAKVAELQAKAQANGMLDDAGNPVAGNMMNGMGAAADMLKQMGGAGAGAAREWELDNIAKHKDGQMNDAELGMANLKNAMNDPAVLGQVSQMMQDPENVAKLKAMMKDPAFQAQAKRVAAQMQASGQMPDFAKMQQAMAGGGMGGMGGMGGQSEMDRLRAENAQLRAAAGLA